MNEDIFDRLINLPGIRIFKPLYRKYKEQLLYLFFGFLATAINVVVFWLSSSVMPPLLANIVAWIVAVLFAYYTNRRWVFQSKEKNIGKEAVLFVSGRLGTLCLEELLLWIGITLLGFPALIVKVIGQTVTIIANYIISKRAVFNKQTRGREI